MDVLTFVTCRAVNSEIIKQVTQSWSIFIQLTRKELAATVTRLREEGLLRILGIRLNEFITEKPKIISF